MVEIHSNETIVADIRNGGFLFRSALELHWALLFRHLNIEYEYLPSPIDLGGQKHQPCFRLPLTERYVDVMRLDLLHTMSYDHKLSDSLIRILAFYGIPWPRRFTAMARSNLFGQMTSWNGPDFCRCAECQAVAIAAPRNASSQETSQLMILRDGNDGQFCSHQFRYFNPAVASPGSCPVLERAFLNARNEAEFALASVPDDCPDRRYIEKNFDFLETD